MRACNMSKYSPYRVTLVDGNSFVFRATGPVGATMQFETMIEASRHGFFVSDHVGTMIDHHTLNTTIGSVRPIFPLTDRRIVL